jgi:anti-sigma regulatory factor (Ser/Thr protein kinase)
MAPALEITKKARPENLRLFLSFVDLACQSHDLTDSAAADVKLAVEEVCNNIIQHGYRNRDAGAITLSCEREDDRFVVTVRDFGHPFDPEDARPADVEAGWEEREVGGLGWHLVKRSVDELRYAPDPDLGNRLVLIKHLDAGS